MCGVHYHTIVMAAVSGDDLFSSGDISRWQAALLCYEQVVELKAAGKTKKAAKSASKDKETLIELDSWYLAPNNILNILWDMHDLRYHTGTRIRSLI